MSLTKPSNIHAVKIAISAYVVKRLGDGLPGLPGHPKTAEQIAIGEIAEAIGYARADLDHPNIRDHLASIVERFGKDAPSDAPDSDAIAKIAAVYHDRPLPRAGIGVNVEAVAEHTGVKVYRLRRDSIERFLLMMAATNGLAAVDRPPTSCAILLEAWAQTLRDKKLKVPVSQNGLAPYYAKIAEEAGLPPNQIGKKELKQQVQRIADELGLEDADSVDDQFARLRDLVDRSIEAGIPMPMAPKGPAYKKLSQVLSMPKQRLENVARFKDECSRWREASARLHGSGAVR